MMPDHASSYAKCLSQPTFDNAYLTKLRAGDAETERHFVAHFTNAIRLSLRYRLRSWELIEDIRQETFLRVLNFLRSDKSLERPERLGAYVHSVCINVMMELLRASTRHPPISDNAQHVIADTRADPEGGVVTRERTEMVRAVLDGMSEKDRQILRAVFLEEADKTEICGRFQVDRAYLRVLVHRAKNRFRQEFDKGGHAPL
jgi:RNA polymerase sigma-70 factor, ECF subfamily